jgi:phycobilisome core linker protein
MRLFKITACIPCPEKVRSQRELQNTYFTKWVMKQGGKILKVELATGRRQQNVGN